VSRFLFVATAGAGGDLPPLISAAFGLRQNGHEVMFLGDHAVTRQVRELGFESEALPSELDLGPRLAAAIRDAMASTGGDLGAAGRIVGERMGVWATETAETVGLAVRAPTPHAMVTSLFGVEVLSTLAPPCPWAVVNSTFYVGPNPPRRLEQDFGPRAIPLISRFASLLESSPLVLHATDQIFDFSFDGLPSHHRYVGPLGIWEPPAEPPAYLSDPGHPWVLVSISTQRQDDVPLAAAALDALDGRDLRVLLTVGPDHDPAELGNVPDNARVEQVAPHSAVLERAALVVSHAGHGTVMKALWHGRPMVLVPWGRDQPGVAARAAALGIGEVIPPEAASAENLRGAIDRVLAGAEFAQAAKRHAARLRATDPQGAAAAALESIV
jgi:UDP:flavonoid glycosyltransferase YjiC (YdhE family)